MGRAFIAPLGTPPDAPGWTEIGTVDHDGLVLGEEPVADGPLHVPSLLPMQPISMKIRLTWYAYRWVFDRTSPRARRVKREYRRRRR